jgi:hypothetical protein
VANYSGDPDNIIRTQKIAVIDHEMVKWMCVNVSSYKPLICKDSDIMIKVVHD